MEIIWKVSTSLGDAQARLAAKAEFVKPIGEGVHSQPVGHGFEVNVATALQGIAKIEEARGMRRVPWDWMMGYIAHEFNQEFAGDPAPPLALPLAVDHQIPGAFDAF